MTAMTRCFECEAEIPTDLWDEHECPSDELPGYDPYEPWMEAHL